MGISIDLHIYDSKELRKALIDLGAENEDLLDKILSKCGHFIGDKYILLNNEYGDPCSPYYVVSELVDSAFKINSWEIFLRLTSRDGISYADAGDIAEELGITLKKEDEDEDE